MKTGIKSLKVFLPQINAYSIEQMGLIDSMKELVSIEPLKQDWQQLFCETVGYPAVDLPWTQLRLSQFNIDASVKTACCIDPVMMQLTHQGAYMMGQTPLNLSDNDSLRIVAQINEQLMDKDENVYLVDKYSWLFTSDKSRSLISQSIQSLIGKDMFNFSYKGEDALYWKQFSMEIQMLIKQMCDYQGLAQSPAETMLNVHCFDLINLNDIPLIPFINNDSLTVISENELIKSFCCKTFLAHKTISDYCENRASEIGRAKNEFSKDDSSKNNASQNNLIIAFDSEKELYPKIIQTWKNTASDKNIKSCQLVCQDAVFELNIKKSFSSRFFEMFGY